MTVISRELFYSTNLSNTKCKDLIHTWSKSCVGANVEFFFFVFTNALRFYVPVYVIQLIINKRKINKDFIKQFIKKYLRSTLYLSFYGLGILSGMCFFHNIFGKIYYYTLGFFPGILAGLSILAETEQNRNLNTILIGNLILECFFKNTEFFNLIHWSKTKQIALFMFISACLMYQFQNSKKKLNLTHLWFYVPSRLEQDIQECYHLEKCSIYFLKGFYKYFLVGYAANLVKTFLSSHVRIFKSILAFKKFLFKKDNFKSGLFMASYVAIYRMVSCILAQYGKKQETYHAYISGALSALTYLIYPNMQMLIIAITTLCQLLYQRIKAKLGIPNKSQLHQQLFFMLSSAILAHNALSCRKTCPSYYLTLLNMCSNYRFDNIYFNVINTAFKHIS